MRKKETHNQTTVKGFYINDLTRGFWGDQNEGRAMLQKMGLPTDIIPFSVAVFLQKQSYHLI